MLSAILRAKAMVLKQSMLGYTTESRKKEGTALALLAMVTPVMLALLQTSGQGEFFFIGGFIIDIAVGLWNDFWNDSEEVAWLEAELEVVERLVDRFSGYSGVWVEDGDGNEIDVDDLAHPNAPDGGMDCIIIVDADEYTDLGFKRMCTEVKNIIINGDY